MRVSVLFALGLATSVLGQAITSGTPDPTTTTIEFITDTDTETTITSTPTSTSSSTFPIASTAAPPVGGGATCVQRCLAEAADNVGCRGGADLTCVCASGSYLSIARTCFSDSRCDDALSQSAVQDYGSACSVSPTPPQPPVTTPVPPPTPTPTPTPTRTTNAPPAPPTTQTVILTSSVVVTGPGGTASTIASGFTTIRTNQPGSQTTGGASGPSTSAGGGSSNGAAGVNLGHLASMRTMVGLGVVGAIVVLLL
ncbi:hypothetical protein RHS02_08864, partial [Rhizoctonia solani]